MVHQSLASGFARPPGKTPEPDLRGACPERFAADFRGRVPDGIRHAVFRRFGVNLPLVRLERGFIRHVGSGRVGRKDIRRRILAPVPR